MRLMTACHASYRKLESKISRKAYCSQNRASENVDSRVLFVTVTPALPQATRYSTYVTAQLYHLLSRWHREKSAPPVTLA